MFNLLKNNKFRLIIVVASCLTTATLCQDSNYKLEVMSNANDTNYWWLTRNNNGKYINNNTVDLQWQLNSSSTHYQIILSNAFNNNQKFDFGESFIKHNFSENIFLRVGKYYRDFSLYLNDDLSSGSMLISNNAQSLPKIGLVGKFDYRKNQNLSFNWGISHGKLDKNDYYSKAPFLHEKFIYINFKKNKYLFGAGFVHDAIWSGTTIQGSHQGKQPGTFRDFLKVFISSDGPLLEGEVHANALGNHLGIWDFYYQKNDAERILKLYYQHYFEDTSSLRFANKTDGLWGIELENYIHNTNILLEYLDTSHCCINPPYQNDQYYYNYQYRSGWSYKNNILGNPFVNSSGFRSGNVELTRLFHIGIQSRLRFNTYKIQASRKINIEDDIKYRISVSREVNQTDFNIFIVGNDNSTAIGFGASYLIKK